MFTVVNLENRTVLTTRDGADLFNVNEECAVRWALMAQELTNCPHVVQDTRNVPEAYQWLQREVAPWLIK